MISSEKNISILCEFKLCLYGIKYRHSSCRIAAICNLKQENILKPIKSQAKQVILLESIGIENKDTNLGNELSMGISTVTLVSYYLNLHRSSFVETNANISLQK